MLELKLSFESIFNPKSVHNLRILTSTRSLSNVGHHKLKKVLVKQSYLLIFWLKFLSTNSSSLIFLPGRGQLHSTKTKSPMAQKTFSQEQYKFVAYRYTSKRITLNNNSSRVRSSFLLSEALFFVLGLRSQGSFFGTNMLFISKIYFFKLVKPCNYLLLNS